MDFYATGMNKLFLIGKKSVLIVMVPILINKDVFEPSLNDLKFMVQKCDCICRNQIIQSSIYNEYSKTAMQISNPTQILSFSFSKYTQMQTSTSSSKGTLWYLQKTNVIN